MWQDTAVWTVVSVMKSTFSSLWALFPFWRDAQPTPTHSPFLDCAYESSHYSQAQVSFSQVLRANSRKCSSYLLFGHSRRRAIMGNNAWHWGLILSARKVAISPSRKSAGTEIVQNGGTRVPTYAAPAALCPRRFFEARQKREPRKRQEKGWVSPDTRCHTFKCEMDSVAQSAFYKAFFPRLPSNLHHSHANYTDPE